MLLIVIQCCCLQRIYKEVNKMQQQIPVKVWNTVQWRQDSSAPCLGLCSAIYQRSKCQEVWREETPPAQQTQLCADLQFLLSFTSTANPAVCTSPPQSIFSTEILSGTESGQLTGTQQTWTNGGTHELTNQWMCQASSMQSSCMVQHSLKQSHLYSCLQQLMGGSSKAAEQAL